MQINFNNRNSKGEVKTVSTSKTSPDTGIYRHPYEAITRRCHRGEELGRASVCVSRPSRPWSLGPRVRPGERRPPTEKGPRRVSGLTPPVRPSARASVHRSEWFSLRREIAGGFPKFLVETVLHFSKFFQGHILILYLKEISCYNDIP